MTSEVNSSAYNLQKMMFDDDEQKYLILIIIRYFDRQNLHEGITKDLEREENASLKLKGLAAAAMMSQGTGEPLHTPPSP